LSIERVEKNYSEWRRVKIVRGCVPEVLPEIDTRQVAFLHLDMKCIYPEAAALRRTLSSGGVVLLDDYAYFGYVERTRAIDEAVAALGVEILVLPTGQGLIVR